MAAFIASHDGQGSIGASGFSLSAVGAYCGRTGGTRGKLGGVAGLPFRVHGTTYLTMNEVRSDPARPQLTTIGHRPGVVLVPTFHLQLMRPPD